MNQEYRSDFSGDKLVLRSYMAVEKQRNKGKQKLALLASMAIMFILLPIVFYKLGFMDKLADLSIEDLVSRLQEKFMEDAVFMSLQFGIMLIILIVMPVFIRMQERQKLIIGRDGIQYQSGLPRFLSKFYNDEWKIAWEDIKTVRVEYNKIFASHFRGSLVFDTGTKTRKIQTFNWVDPDDNDYKRYNPIKVSLSGASSHVDLLRQHPVYRYLKEYGKEPVLDDDIKTQLIGYDLAKNKYAMTIVTLFFILVFYSFVDSLINTERFIDGGFWWHYFGIGFAGFSLAYQGLQKGNVPATESVIVSILLGGALCFAMYPASLRINQLTDTAGLSSYEYVKTGTYIYEPVIGPELPVLIFDRNMDYWASFEIGSTYDFKLRFGGLGFYQYDSKDITDDMRKYYRDR